MTNQGRRTKDETRKDLAIGDVAGVLMADGFDLEERTALYGEAIIAFCRQVAADDVTAVLIRQLIRSGTSIGANYCEANIARLTTPKRRRIFAIRLVYAERNRERQNIG